AGRAWRTRHCRGSATGGGRYVGSLRWSWQLRKPQIIARRDGGSLSATARIWQTRPRRSRPQRATPHATHRHPRPLYTFDRARRRGVGARARPARRVRRRAARPLRLLPAVAVVVAELLRRASRSDRAVRPRLRLRAARPVAAEPQRQLAAALP